MYNDLADAVESLKEEGFVHQFEAHENHFSCDELGHNFDPEDLKIVESYTEDQGTDPGSESTLYALESNSGVKGLLIISFGMYSDPNKAKLIDRLLEENGN